MKNITIIISLLFLLGCDSSSNGPTYTECECKEIFNTVLNPIIYGTEAEWTNINTCFNDYIQEKRSDGSRGLVNNINPCYKEAFQYGLDLDDVITRAGMCDCREENSFEEDKLTENDYTNSTDLHEEIIELNIADELNDIIQQAVDNEISNITHSINALNISNASFEIFKDKFIVSNSVYYYESIKYLDNYLCIFSRNSQLKLISHMGSEISLNNFKFEEIDGLNGKEAILYNNECEFYYTEYRSSLEYEVFKFNKPRSIVIEELSVHGGKYIGRGLIKKTTARQVWKEYLSMEENMKLYGMDAWVYDKEYKSSESVEQLSTVRGWDYGKSIFSYHNLVPIIEDVEGQIVENIEDPITTYETQNYWNSIEKDLDLYIRDNPSIKENAKDLLLEAIEEGIITIEDVQDLLSKNTRKKLKKIHIQKFIRSKQK